MKFDIFSFALLILLLGYLVINIFFITDVCKPCEYCENIQKNAERMAMFNRSFLTEKVAQGVYYHKEEFYCVWVGDRLPNNINDTNYHEMCHHFVKKEKEHFCGG